MTSTANANETRDGQGEYPDGGNERDRAFSTLIQNPRFLAEKTRNNIRACLTIAVSLFALGVVGMMAAAMPWAKPDVFTGRSTMYVYLIITVVACAEVLALRSVRDADDSQMLHARAVGHACLVIDGFLSAITLLGSQVGSGYYVELAIVMMGVAAIPVYAPWVGVATVLASALPLAFTCAVTGFVPIGQEICDLVVLYVLCLAVMRFRRSWFIDQFMAEEGLRDTNARLYQRARTDTLTGLGSRDALSEDLSLMVGSDLCVVLFDLDDFKVFNARLGRKEGDLHLQQAAASLADAFKGTPARCYRYGGDEFLVLAPSMPLDEVKERVGAFQGSVLSGGVMEGETVSAGYCWGHADGERTVRACVTVAENCLVDAKAAGRGQAKGMPLDAGVRKEDEDRDHLTGLPNSDSFYQRVALADPERPGWALVSFDVDNFQMINKEQGYATGDAILVDVARCLAEHFPNCPITRSEDHFQVFTTLPEVETRVRSVQRQIASSREHLFLFLRAGIYEADSPQRVCPLRQAVDMAKYACDQLRGQSSVTVRFYDEELDHRREAVAFVQNNFKKALAEGHIVPYFQPLVGAFCGKCCGFESLARWVDPDRGLISPGVFVPVLERSHESYLLDLHILECVCQLLSEMDEGRRANLHFSVNLSRTDFQAVDIPLRVDQIVSKYKAPKSALRLEVTESAFIDSNGIREDVQRLRDLGYLVWLDDFGSGVSSMNVLKDYEVDAAKLDMEFVRSLETNERARLVIQSTVRLCHEVGMVVIVEGVETRRQLDFICSVGGSIIQGFYYSRPLSKEDLLKSAFWNDYAPWEEILFYRVAANVPLAYLESEEEDSEELLAILECQDGVARVLRSDNRARECLDAIGLPRSFEKWVRLGEEGLPGKVAGLLGEAIAGTPHEDVWTQGEIGGQTYYLGAAVLTSLEDQGRTMVRLKMIPAPGVE